MLYINNDMILVYITHCGCNYMYIESLYLYINCRHIMLGHQLVLIIKLPILPGSSITATEELREKEAAVAHL